ncbi:hypothetical protein BGZ98_008412 [Dissophora globulifera]|nr:hypothetical protein BGZ98_008412 [Dissophora globulifera]
MSSRLQAHIRRFALLRSGATSARHIRPALFASRSYVTAQGAQDAHVPDVGPIITPDHTARMQEHDAASSVLKPYSFHGVSERNMLMCEMRNHRVSWTRIAEYFGMRPMEALYLYIGSASMAMKHSWVPRMTAQDINTHLDRPNW